MMVQLPPITGDDRRLPSGGKVDFGNKKKNHSRQNSKVKDKPSLPDGSKPVFNDDEKSKGKYDKEKKKDNKKKVDAYAGSSFHSSPEALKLPKPTFKSSPKPSASNLQKQPIPIPNQMPMPGNPNQVPMPGYPNQPPAQGHPMPNYPYYYYPQPMMMNPNMPQPPNTQQPQQPPNTQLPQQPSKEQLGPPMPMMNQFPGQVPGYYYPYFMNSPPNPNQPHPQPHQQVPPGTTSPSNHEGQKISFNDLLGSSK